MADLNNVVKLLSKRVADLVVENAILKAELYEISELNNKMDKIEGGNNNDTVPSE